ncbi:hypothetical protein GOHSU_43_00340 [Gordonia hirsuta DSM 44140 = NBRC 16056]|uniref:DUF1542 domain-containing protein n=1 Tax=Gordonia hirsuta DSM 44140 = NBRC 16056 TaxID=1121927 RepID=L7LBT6_9ACTN|nr:hypothetical protein [Gordonia hirsuta]GAC58590.1 hypothetical protein GOHSU_43_00340 [Gordonia hirsuta DSM 44140 = NBRC 16056]
MTALIWIVVVLIIVMLVVALMQGGGADRAQRELADAQADARQAINRLGGQVYLLEGTNPAATQALADAGERYNAAGAQIDHADTPRQAHLAKQTALEGLYYVRAARTAMDMDPGPPVQGLDGQAAAGRVTEVRTVDFEGRQISASPDPSATTPNYFPGGRVAGRPVPAGWYSEAWWRPALIGGMWGVGSMLLFSSLFSGMSGVHYGADAFAQGDTGLDDGGMGDAGIGDGGMGDGGMGDDFGGGLEGFDFGGFDF